MTPAARRITTLFRTELRTHPSRPAHGRDVAGSPAARHADHALRAALDGAASRAAARGAHVHAMRSPDLAPTRRAASWRQPLPGRTMKAPPAPRSARRTPRIPRPPCDGARSTSTSRQGTPTPLQRRAREAERRAARAPLVLDPSKQLPALPADLLAITVVFRGNVDVSASGATRIRERLEDELRARRAALASGCGARRRGAGGVCPSRPRTSRPPRKWQGWRSAASRR